MRSRRVVSVGALAVVLSGAFLAPGWAGEAAGLRERVLERMARAGLERQAEVRVEVLGDRVRLSGEVATFEARAAAEKAARKEASDVENRIRVVPAPRGDGAIGAEIADAILRYPYYTVFDSVDLAVKDGVVTLSGSVKEPYRKDDIGRLVARVGGIREIRDQIRVQPASIFDDRLRYALAAAIYRSDLFSHYSIHADPPIRILVENGRVTLTGYVASEVERVALGAIARSSPAFGVDNRVKLEGGLPGRAPARAQS